ncbi:MAG: hypothetical protein A2600_03520 [Candidatus Lambdaproteobacteria bacterium RIFOXYD1_FULL_56_27]|uniref:Aminotransferase class V domain-containing protein n=1 Tax=Candidatus Lambdaproteobacteria bacterium RIFOXYD2_FULL_56_26 TaxID=1817773 RepID=A0A1F6H381_9PROT|nr:MAG: hypothetical protein A2426_11580 [Candidatus Lambdaproteobacteria bacterium RIFOXYC1_FULL_56_13]OGH04839.1 MAG: hypothetical protein A2557_07585 [Candidatus Lambdaproteobacteria bacterium RIFOXYD2_FULL_56_26]OGH09304.1 MAG: hypothetical protein A2600_03520 [Candidatus Lambdaproteobacteria bacterium RIFOXYD1_FULL_56_27]
MLYLDAAASTRPHPDLLARLAGYAQLPHANPSSVHPWGMTQKKELDWARRDLARLFSVPLEGIVFCGSGTEADNLAIKGTLVRGAKNLGRFLTSPLEHKAVTECAAWYQDRGGPVDWVRIHPKTGQVDPEDLKAKLTAETRLVSIGQVNGETGTTQDLKALGQLIKAQNPKTLFHSDGVQGLGKLKPELGLWGVDLYSVSGHKVHGVWGGAALVLTRPLLLEPLLHGGGQEGGLRSGTENVPACLGLSWAADWAEAHRQDHWQAVQAWGDRFWLTAKGLMPSLRRLETGFQVPHILSLQVPGLLGEVWLHHLAARGILASQGSACQARSKKLSLALKALGLTDEEIRGTIRLSLSPLELTQEPEPAAQQLVQAAQAALGKVDRFVQTTFQL